MSSVARARLRLLLHLALMVSVAWVSGPQDFLPARAQETTAPLATGGNSYTYLYDPIGRLAAVVDPAGETAVYSYDTLGNILSITRHSSTTVKVIATSRGRGPVGASVIIYGTGFSATPGQNSVTFNGAAATVTASTATQIETSVPTGATSGPIAVTAPAGGATSASNFTVVSGGIGAPTITSISPAIGDRPTDSAPGTTVTITGTNFETGDFSEKKLTFNGTYAPITSANATSITTSVPPVTGSGRLAVSTPAGQVVSTADFFVPPAPYAAADVQASATGRLAPGTPYTATISTAQKIGLILFDSAASQRVSLKLSGVTTGANTKVAIYDPAGTSVGSLTVGNGGGFLDPQPLVMPGTYTILVDPDSNNTGSVTLTLYSVLADATAPTLTPGGSSQTVNLTAPGQNAALTVAGTSGQRISLAVNGALGANSGISLYDPNGKLVAIAPANSGGSRLVASPALTATGTYQLLLDPPGDSTGSLTVTPYNLPADGTGTLSAGGAGTAVALTTPGQQAALTYTNATANQRVTLSTAGGTTLSSGRVLVTDPAGAWIASGPVAGGTTAATVTLPTTGDYTVRVVPDGTNTGNLTLQLNMIPAGPDTLTVGGPAEAIAVPAAGAGQPPATVTRTFQGNTGQRINLLISDVTIPWYGAGTRIRLTDPDGVLVSDSYVTNGVPWGSSPGGVLPTPPLALTKDGPYTVAITPEFGHYSGNVTLRVLDVVDVQTTLNLAGPTVVDLPTPGQLGWVTFWGRAGQTLHLTATTTIVPFGAGTPVTVYAPDGTVLATTGVPQWATGGWPIPLPAPLPADGLYTILVDPALAKTGTMTFNLVAPIPPAAPPGYTPPAIAPVPGSDAEAGDPVDLATGLFVLNKTDLILPDTLPLAVNRTYRPQDTQARPFGIGTTDSYELYLWTDNYDAHLTLILPDGGRVRFARTNPGTDLTRAVFEHTSTPTALARSRITWSGQGWDLALVDNGGVYRFGRSLMLQAMADRFGNQITLRRSNGETGYVTHVRSPNGRWLALTYETYDTNKQRVSQIKDNGGRSVGYTYDASNRLWQVTNPNSGVTEYGYDASQRLTTIEDARDVVFLTNEYDTNGRVQKQIQADGSYFEFSYTLDAGGKVTQAEVRDPRGTLYRTVFDSAGYPITRIAAVGQPEEQTASYEYDANTHQLTAATNPLGHRTRYIYDTGGSGQLLEIETRVGTSGPLLGRTNFVYHPTTGEITQQIDYPDLAGPGLITTFDYDDKRLVSRVTDPLGHQTTFTYTATGQIETTKDAIGQTSGQLTRHNYFQGELVAVTDPLNRASRQWSDALGRPVIAIGPLGQFSRTSYDVLNHVTQASDPLGRTTALTYDDNGNLRTVTDPLGRVTRYDYNDMDRLITHTLPEPTPGVQRVASFGYDENGNLIRSTDPRGQVTITDYDRLDRPTFVGINRNPPNGGTPTYDRTYGYTYDIADRVTQISDSGGSPISYRYDDVARTSSETTQHGPTSYTVSYLFDAMGRPTRLSVPGQSDVRYCYDAHRLKEIRQGTLCDDTVNPPSARFDYDAADRRTGLTLPNGVRTEYDYNDGGELTSQIYQIGTATLGDLTYTHDVLGRLQSEGGSYARRNLPAAVSSASYNAANQLTTWNGAGGYTYDLNGNLTSDGSQSYVWDAEDQLKEIKIGATSVASYQYDATGRRQSKTIGSSTTRFLYDGGQIVQEQNGSGSVLANLLGGAAVDEVLSRTDSAGRRSYLADGLGSTVALTDDAGAVPTEYAYEPFGRARTLGAASPNAYQYTGRENDAGTGLQYNRARYYAPGLGRFLSEDPLGFGGGDLHLYSYTGNSPTNATDPSGQLFIWPFVAICIGGAAAEVFTTWFEAMLDGRKLTVEELVGAAAWGCILDLATFGLGKGLKLGARAAQLVTKVAKTRAAARVVNRARNLGNRLGRRVPTPCGLGNSFSGDTPVATADGEKPIRAVKPGDRVLAWDEAQATSGYYPVTATVHHTDALVVQLLIDGELVTTTLEHSFATEEQGWVAAGALHKGLHVRRADGRPASAIQATRRVVASQPMYNLTVAGAHTFTVGDPQWLVHNPQLHRGKGGVYVLRGQFGTVLYVGSSSNLPARKAAHHILREREGLEWEVVYHTDVEDEYLGLEIWLRESYRPLLNDDKVVIGRKKERQKYLKAAMDFLKKNPKKGC